MTDRVGWELFADEAYPSLDHRTIEQMLSQPGPDVGTVTYCASCVMEYASKMASRLKSILNYRISETEIPKYRLNELPKLALGAAIIGGGIYGLVHLMIRKKDEREIAAITQLRQQHEHEEAAKAARVATVRGWSASGERGHYR